MKTYQDLLDVGVDESARMSFVLAAIDEHKRSPVFFVARDAEMYDKRQNVTIQRPLPGLYT